MVTRPSLKRHRFNVDEYHRMAKACIPEVWIADPRRRFLLHRSPEGKAYTDVSIVKHGTIAPLTFPDLTIAIESILD